MEQQGATNQQRVRTKVLGLAALVWTGIVLVLLIWQMIAYRGFVARIVEWQFATFDRSFPTATLALLLLLFISPFLIILGLRIRKERSYPGARSRAAALAREHMLGQFLLAISAVMGVCAIVVAALAFTIGGVSEKPQGVTLAQIAAGPVAEGPTRIQGTILYDRIGFFENSLLFTRWTLWVSPITAGDREPGIHVFAETERRKASKLEHGERAGILRRQAMPGPLRRLYQNAGYRVDEPTYVLFRDLASARAPYFAAALDLAIVAILFAVFFFVQLFRRRRLERSVVQERAAEVQA